MSIQKGDPIPKARIFELDAQGAPHAVSAAERFGGKRIVLFAVPGAFTRTCSQVHLPSFVQRADAIKAQGVDEIVCLAVNDVNVLAAWAREHGATGKISMVSDGLAEFTRAIGLDQDLSERGLGVRSKRYAMIIEDGKVSDIQVEPPGACEISKGDAVLQRLGSQLQDDSVAKESEVLRSVQATLTSADPATLVQHAALPDLNKEEIARQIRHLIMPEVGMAGQCRLKAASVLLIGAGGLGSRLGLYLTAAGVGRIGLVDFDVVDYSNLQRQVIHGTKDVGRPKLQSAKDRLMDVNPFVHIDTYDVHIDTYETTLRSDNALELFEAYDVIIDGTDNFPTRYLTNDASVLLGKPNVYGSIFRFEGQASVFFPRGSRPCYRCLYPDPPPPGLVPSCAEGGVLGILPGIVGLIQAAEAVKLILGEGEALIGRLLLFNALQMRFRELKLRRDPTCPLCGANPVIRELIDYDQFCGVTPPEEEATGAADWEITVTENNWHTTKWLGTAARVVWLSLAICVLTVQAAEPPKRATSAGHRAIGVQR